MGLQKPNWGQYDKMIAIRKPSNWLHISSYSTSSLVNMYHKILYFIYINTRIAKKKLCKTLVSSSV